MLAKACNLLRIDTEPGQAAPVLKLSEALVVEVAGQGKVIVRAKHVLICNLLVECQCFRLAERWWDFAIKLIFLKALPLMSFLIKDNFWEKGLLD